jgi:hypothetical protein
MQLIKEISANEMIGEFLKAELHSSRFRAGSLRALTMLGYNEELIESPQYNDASQNKKRVEVLGLCRGWPNTDLFTNFPSDSQWFMVKLSLADLKNAYRLKSDPDMKDSDRLLVTTANRVMKGETVPNIDNKLIGEIREKIEQQVKLPPVILVSTSLEHDKRVLIEGHSRSVAYSSFKHLPYDVAAIIGVSGNMANWPYF